MRAPRVYSDGQLRVRSSHGLRLACIYSGFQHLIRRHTQVVRHLAVLTRDADERIMAVFDIDMVEEMEGWVLDDIPDAPAPRPKREESSQGLSRSVQAIAESLDAIELLSALQLTEEQKLDLIEKLKAFLTALFGAIDLRGKSNTNDIHRKMITAMAK